ncbi:MAG: TetR/AcrR family transcriptional regulator [Myxococcota bacterium]
MARASQHKENLLHTAVRLFRRQGYASTGLQQILAESGAPKGSLYHYFPGGKEAIGAEAVALAGRLVAETLETLAKQHRSAKTFVRAYCRQYADWMEESGFQSGCPIATTLLEEAPRSAPITAAGRAAIDSWIAIIGEVYARAGASPVEAKRQARFTISALEGALILSRVTRSRDPILDVGHVVARML